MGPPIVNIRGAVVFFPTILESPINTTSGYFCIFENDGMNILYDSVFVGSIES